jgi:hypothetical protein
MDIITIVCSLKQLEITESFGPALSKDTHTMHCKFFFKNKIGKEDRIFIFKKKGDYNSKAVSLTYTHTKTAFIT